MVIFFFVVGLEIKYELVNGDLRDPRTAALPIIAAVGGMVVPAGALRRLDPPGSDGAGAGWGIPMATDIAFAVGVLGLLGRRIPSALRLFLLTLAIVDDIGAIIVIAVFYTATSALRWLAIAIGLLAVMVVAAEGCASGRSPVYAVLGVVVWFALLESGVHATLAGRGDRAARAGEGAAQGGRGPPLRPPGAGDHHLDPDELARCGSCSRSRCRWSSGCSRALHPLSSYVVLPVFALANAGVELGGDRGRLSSPSRSALGIMLGLVLGKPVGILLASFLAVRLGLGRLPERTTWPMLVGLGAVAGIGFTVSIFIAGLSFPGAELADRRGEDRRSCSRRWSPRSLGVVVLLLATARPGGVRSEEPG